MNCAHRNLRSRLAVWFVAIFALAGCSDGSGRVGITGQVTLNGVGLVDQGTIQFVPLDAGGGGGAGSPIMNGAYAVPRAKGLKPGEYRVRIYAPTLVKAEQDAPGPLGLAPPRERVAKQFNVESNLTANVTGTEDLTINFLVEPSSAKE